MTGTRATLGVVAILRERERQVVSEGYDPEQDRGRAPALFAAAAEYAIAAQRATAAAGSSFRASTLPVPFGWPWEAGYWKPSDDPIRNAEKAGALLAAGIDALLLERPEQDAESAL